MISAKLPQIFYGGDYNPEQWPEEVWLDDMRLMKRAGVNLVSIAIFAWAKLESAPGVFHFEWLDRLMDLLAANGIFADLATATASPPAWLVKMHPEILPTKADGTRLWPGARQHYNPSSRAYREACARLVRALATRYKDHAALAVWHINNEYACHVSEDYSDETAEAFRDWLKRRYRTVDGLNNAWGTAFWSQHYYDWSEIFPPRQAPTFPNPGQTLDFKRFSSDSLLECYLNEKRILSEVTPDIPVTTNFLGWHPFLDYRKWAQYLDFTCWDAYPEPLGPPTFAAANHDLMRSLKDGTPFVLMEQVTTQVNWRQRNPLKRPGVMRLWSLQTLARGGDGVLFFQWRQSRAGAEKFHGAMLPHGDPEKNRAFAEVTQLGAELQNLREIAGSRINAETAIIFDYENWWALELPSKPNSDVKYIAQIETFHNALFERNIPVDFAFCDSDFSKYKLIIAPALYMIKPGVADKLALFVERGGTLVVSFFSGIVDECDRIHLGGYPAPLRRLLGIEVEEFDPLPENATNCISSKLSGVRKEYETTLWSDVIRSETADVLATFVHDFYAGRPAVTCNQFSAGKAYYIGMQAELAFYSDLIDRVTAESGVRAPLDAPAGVEVTMRENGTSRFFFLLNHLEHPVELRGAELRGFEMLAQKPCDGAISLTAKGAAVIRQER